MTKLILASASPQRRKLLKILGLPFIVKPSSVQEITTITKDVAHLVKANALLKARDIAKKFKSGIVIGPLDKKGLPKIEAHLIGFKGNLYKKNVTLEIRKFLRKFKKFKNESELIKQIGKDLERCYT